MKNLKFAALIVLAYVIQSQMSINDTVLRENLLDLREAFAMLALYSFMGLVWYKGMRLMGFRSIFASKKTNVK